MFKQTSFLVQMLLHTRKVKDIKMVRSTCRVFSCWALQAAPGYDQAPVARENSRIWNLGARKVKDLALEHEKTRGAGPLARENSRIWRLSTRKLEDLAWQAVGHEKTRGQGGGTSGVPPLLHEKTRGSSLASPGARENSRIWSPRWRVTRENSRN